MLNRLLYLIKTGIVFSNLLTAVTGFMLASINGINFSLLLFSIVGITLVLCSATSLNN